MLRCVAADSFECPPAAPKKAPPTPPPHPPAGVQFSDASASAPLLFLSVVDGAPRSVATLLAYEFVVSVVVSDGCSASSASASVVLSCAASLTLSPGAVAVQARAAVAGGGASSATPSTTRPAPRIAGLVDARARERRGAL